MFVRVVLLVSSVLFALVISEVSLRLSGYQPFQVRDSKVSLYAEDAMLGWKQVPGNHKLRIPVSRRIFETRILDDGTRATGQDSSGSYDSAVFFIGGSITHGFGLEDSDSLPWKVQGLMPNQKIFNLAVNGYGTYQSLLNLKRHLDRYPVGGGSIVYGYCPCHHNRNRAHPDWRRVLASLSRRGDVRLPYCIIDKKRQLKCIEPKGVFMKTFLRENLAFFYILERAFNERDRSKCDQERDEVSKLLLEEVRKFAQSKNLNFYVLPVSSPPRLSLEEYQVLPCFQERYATDEYKLEDDPHPNERWTTEVSRCVAHSLGKDDKSFSGFNHISLLNLEGGDYPTTRSF